MSEQKCYCGNNTSFAECCEPILKGDSKARTPEELMRARYSAHCIKDYDFLVESTHPDHRGDVSTEEISSWASHVTWERLEVHSAVPGDSDDEGIVSFTAHFSLKDSAQELREDSLFQKVDGEWKYVDGKLLGGETYRREAPRVGRNEPCPCGSNKKYKKCCGSL